MLSTSPETLDILFEGGSLLLVATVGLPASGKSTWAREAQKRNPRICLVSKDDIRLMLHSGKYTPENERMVVRVRDAIVTEALSDHRSVIVHDTNLSTHHLDRLQRLALKHGAQMLLNDTFLETDLEECIRRDGLRGHTQSVGRDVIIGMYHRYPLWWPHAQ